MSFSAGKQRVSEFHDMETGNNKELDLCHAMQDFITHLKAAGRSPSTILCYLHDLKLLGKNLGNMRLSRITDSHLENVVIQLNDFSARGSARTAATLNRTKSVYRSFFRWSFESGRAPHNAAARLYLARTKSRPTAPITMAEIVCLLNTIRKSEDPLAERDEALFAVYAFTGDILLVSRAMGHVDIQTTRRYIDDTMYGVREAVEKTFHQIIVED